MAQAEITTRMKAPLRLLRCLIALIVSVSLQGHAMELGTNFWNIGWHKPTDCFQDFRKVSGDNPWNPQFLKEIAIYRSLRFMDWDNTNNSERERWEQRTARTAEKQNPVAYEWMIDLCNRNGSDMWVTIPHRTISATTGDGPVDYVLRLCLLAKTGVDMGSTDLAPLMGRLNSVSASELIAAGGVKTCEPLAADRRLYLEYSNETWNGIFKQAPYCEEQGVALALHTDKRTAGVRYHAWAAIRMFRAGELVFGAESPQLVKVLAAHSANIYGAQQQQAVMADAKLNPHAVKASVIAIAPYFGHKVDGEAADAADALRAEIAKVSEQVAKYRKLAEDSGLRLFAYEGGQHVHTNAKRINRDPAMHGLYQEYLQAMSRHIEHFSHYAHVGQAGDKGAWGCIEFTGQPIEEAHKYRALVQWSRAGAARK
jgi:hypothetical protein